jgi:hypothetical protein
MTLKEKLDALREGSKKRIPPEAATVMHRATNELRRSGILGGVAKAGDKVRDFALPNSSGEIRTLRELLGTGPVVLSFFRGVW